jgi:hypothetical protein
LRTPAFLVLDDGIPAAGITVCIDSYSVVAPPSSTVHLECNSDDVNYFKNTLQGIALARPCEVSISNKCKTSEPTGLVNFSALEFGSSPTGTYSIAFATRNTQPQTVISNDFTTQVPPFSGAIRLISNPPTGLTPLLPVLPSPKFQVELASGLPAPAGVQLRAFVWDSFSDPFGNTLNINADEYSFGELLGDTAVTDANGIATFSSLQLLGSSSSSIFINVTIANTVFSSLSANAIPVVSRVASVSIQSNLVSENVLNVAVTEGKPFPFPIQVKLNCNMPSHLCANRRVYASLDSLSGNRLRKVQFRSFFKEAPKVLYNTTATTDSDGVATFDALQFSVDGRSGIFEISFVCDGIYSASSVVGTFTGSAISSLTFDSQVSYSDFCGKLRKLEGEEMFTITNADTAVSIKLGFDTYYSETSLPVSGKKTVKVFVESSVPGVHVDFPVVPMLTEIDGNFVVSLNVFPHAGGIPLHDVTVSLYIGVDDDANSKIDFQFKVDYDVQCPMNELSLLMMQYASPPCSSGSISLFKGTYLSSDSRIWTPFDPAQWNSADKFSLNFTLISHTGHVVCGDVPSSLLVTATPKQECLILVSSHYVFLRLDLYCFLALSNPLFIIEFVGINTGP